MGLSDPCYGTIQDIIDVCNNVFKQAGIEFTEHPSSRTVSYPYDTKAIQHVTNYASVQQAVFVDDQSSREPDGVMSQDEQGAFFKFLLREIGGPVQDSPADLEFEVRDPARSIAIVRRGASSYSGDGMPPFARGFSGDVVFSDNLVEDLQLMLAIAHEFGHGLDLSTMQRPGENPSGHDLGPYHPSVIGDHPNGTPPSKPGNAYAGQGTGGTPHLDDPLPVIMGPGSPVGGKLPWLYGRWMRWQDWEAANIRAGQIENSLEQ